MCGCRKNRAQAEPAPAEPDDDREPVPANA